MIRKAEIVLESGSATVIVDGKSVPADVRVTFKRDGSLSTLKVSTGQAGR